MPEYVEEREDEVEKKTNYSVLIRLLPYMSKYKVLLSIMIICVIFTAFAESLGTFYIKKFVDDGIVKESMHDIIVNMSIYSGIMVVMGFTIFGFILTAGWLGEHVYYDLRKKMFNHLQKLSFSYFDKTPVGWIISRVMSDTNRIGELISWYFLDSLWAVTNIISAVIFMLILNFKLGVIVSLVLPILVFVGARFQYYIIREYRKVRELNSRITGAYNENITGVRIVKALVRENKNLRIFDKLTTKMHNASFKATWLSAMFLPVVQIITAVGCGVVIWYGGFQVKNALFTVGGLQAFVTYITFMMWPVQDIARVYAQMQQSIASAERVFNLLDTAPDIEDSPGVKELCGIDGVVEFENVSFSYEPDKPVLTGFNLKVKRGETIALVGPTGGGKTTIVNLIARFYEPVDGRILIDGIDYREYSQLSLQSRFGVMLQNPQLFSGTIAENIRYGRLDATDDEVKEAAKFARANVFITEFEKGYDELVGEGGALLSVGQKQLISLARAILADPDIMIMDEATSSIDTMTEKLIQEGLDTLLADCTSFVIAHRLSTIRNADRILVIEDGRIKEEGTHRELLRLKGHYYRLYTNQYRLEREKELSVTI